MSEEQWTPGPWEKEWNGYYFEIKNVGNIHSLASINSAWGSDCGPGTQEGNANLIAAAPKLYNALKAAMEFIDANVGDPDLTGEMVEAWSRLQDAKPHEALAKARGES